ncbi:hypothetical protein IW140_006086 [Coemansia sp. RSA 1813]|nr:hypothetical protein EV178_006064 [Coemansia sp. RSA 1646]KAJ1766390.1 hypothetical protein LPJ74_005919 [Coemansia sp. RSA 1843]KAJ2085934.1 hypothetical protein IW138_006031 [Coemansia sp. RSA 986]KAJ2210209.1 hypothetical protein EV179_006386 [Coemansia sp. RSA 487]KAJ2563494.1 hypothetical protein IW140_006086 [Coemansia sp. RSA 1813]
MAATTYKIFTVDAFAKAAFSGNQAGVVPVPADIPLSDQVMQQVAAEMNIAETAFFTPAEPGETFEQASRFTLRWFTPATEVKLCGHATLATARVLFDELRNQNHTLYFETLSGELVVRKDKANIEMTFPADAPEPVDATSDAQTLARAFAGDWDARTEITVSPFLRYMVIHNPGYEETALIERSPKVTQDILDAGARLNVVAVITTWRAKDGKDYKCRVFAPWAGIDEDPVTGSAQTVLAPFWQQRLNKSAFASQQCSPRGGELGATLVDDKVAVSGQAVVVIRGSLAV